jgi:hypothetical protein
MNGTKAQHVYMAPREHVKSLCAPISWESARQTVVNGGTMCDVRTPQALLGITNRCVAATDTRDEAMMLSPRGNRASAH